MTVYQTTKSKPANQSHQHPLPTIDSQSQFSSTVRINANKSINQFGPQINNDLVICATDNMLDDASRHSPSTRMEKNTNTELSTPWVFVPNPTSGVETSRILKKKHHDILLNQVKALEQKLKEQRRINEKKRAKVLQERQYLEKQRGLTDRIKNYESRQSETAMTLQMSIDQTSNFNPEVSITQYTDKSLLVQ